MTAKLVQEWWPTEFPKPVEGRDTYLHGQCMFEGDNADEVRAACRAWCWEKIGDTTGSFIRLAPTLDNARDGEAWVSRARLSVCVHHADELEGEIGFGNMPELERS